MDRMSVLVFLVASALLVWACWNLMGAVAIAPGA